MTETKMTDLHRTWMPEDRAYAADHAALDGESSLAATIMRARAAADLTQPRLAERMHTTQAVIARLESGRARPSTRTLERLAEATGSVLHIGFLRPLRP